MLRRTLASVIHLLLTLVVGLVLGSIPAAAVTFYVEPGAVIVAADGLCSLREAIHNANDDAQVDNDDCPAGSLEADDIELAPGSLYVLPDADALNHDTGLPIIEPTISAEVPAGSSSMSVVRQS